MKEKWSCYEINGKKICKKNSNIKYVPKGYLDFNKTNDYTIIENLLNKFGQLEDIEDELGIDLITLFKALKQGEVYVKSGNKVDWEIPMSGFQICGDKTNGITLWSQVRLDPKEYGKTWALTREELL